MSANGHGKRLMMLETVRRRGRCWPAGGPVCRRVVPVGDGSDDPPVPVVPATCADCRRPVVALVRIYRGVDVDDV